MSHPSFLDLDRAYLGADGGDAAAHAAGCDECRAHLDRCEMATAIPAGLRERAARRSRAPWRWLLLVPALAAVALAAQRRDTITAKGSPTVAVYVRHAASVSLWDGQTRVAPGDGLQLKVSPAGFTRVTVASVEPAGMVELYASSIAARGETMLPQSWTVDAAPGPEIMLIVFSRAPLSPSDLRAARDDLPRNPSLWTTRVELWKGARP